MRRVFLLCATIPAAAAGLGATVLITHPSGRCAAEGEGQKNQKSPEGSLEKDPEIGHWRAAHGRACLPITGTDFNVTEGMQ